MTVGWVPQRSFEGVEGLVLDNTIGGARIWKVRYRIRRGGQRIERKIKLGMLDPEARRRTGNDEAHLSPGQAKDRADDVLGKVRAGQDPWLEKHEAEFTPKPEAVSFANDYQQWLINPGIDPRHAPLQGPCRAPRRRQRRPVPGLRRSAPHHRQRSRHGWWTVGAVIARQTVCATRGAHAASRSLKNAAGEEDFGDLVIDRMKARMLAAIEAAGTRDIDVDDAFDPTGAW